MSELLSNSRTRADANHADDFTQLNEKFIKARRDYEALLESSMSHPPAPTYHQYAMRPQIPQGYPPPGQGYGAPPPQQQEPQRFYTPAPVQGTPSAELAN